MLSQKDRKMSAPAFSLMHPAEDVEAQNIVRSAEMDNIPEQVDISRQDQMRRIR